MKKIIFILIIVLTSIKISAQTYTVNIKGHITINGGAKKLSATCTDAKGNGLMNIVLVYQDGTRDYLLNKPLNTVGVMNKDFDYSKKIPISKRIREITIYSATIKRNKKPGSDKCNESWYLNKRIPVGDTHCFYKTYTKNEIFEGRFGPGSKATINITPDLELNFADGRPNTSIYQGCADGAIGIKAPSGFVSGNDIYVWEFLDHINKKRQLSIGYINAKKDEENKRYRYESCKYYSGGACGDLLIEWKAAVALLKKYENGDLDKYEEVPVWRLVSNVRGRSDVAIKLSDIYSNTEDQKKALTKNIDIRLNPSCYISPKKVTPVTVQYLPPPPKIARVPKIEPMACSYSATAEFTLFFDRQVQDHEAININLLVKDVRTGAYRSVDNNTNIKSFTKINNSTWGYKYKPGKNITVGDYKIEVSGYKRGGNSATPFCKQYEYLFSVSAPSRVRFDAEKIRDEVCYGSKDGQIIITASGGTGSYQYSLDNGRTWVSLPESPYTVKELPPKTYNIQVRDSRGCFDKDNATDLNKSIPVTIDAIAQIEHQILADGVVHPSVPNAKDATITINRVRGGTPFTGVGYMYKYQVFLNGSTSFTSGTITASSTTISNLPAGNHTIVYTDAKGCSTIPPINLPEIEDPLPIQFDIQKQEPNCSDADGSLEIINLRGGYAPYTVSWSKDGIGYGTGTIITGNLGSYDVVIIDKRGGRAEQTGIQFDNVPQPISIASIDIQPILCYGDKSSVTITAIGGKSGEYQYALWTGAATSVWQDSNVFALDANTTSGYRFRIRDRNVITCDSEISDRQLIDQPSRIDISIVGVTHNNIFNDNKGSIEINVAGGTPDYGITWERNGVLTSHTGTSVSGLTAGDYVAVVKDVNNCEVRSLVIPIEEPEELTVSIKETISIPCYNEVGALTANVKGGSLKYTYQWFKDGKKINDENSNTLSDIKAGSYSVHIEDGYTSTDISYKLEEPKELILPLPAVKHVSCFLGNDGKIIANPSGGTRPYYFSIDDKKTYISEDDLTNLTLEKLGARTYDVWLKDANGCEIATPQTVTLNSPDEIKVTAKSIVHTTTVGGTNGSIILNDITGGTGTYTYSWNKLGDAGFIRTTKDIDNLSIGAYTISVQDANACIAKKTFEISQPLLISVDIEIKNPILCYDDALGELLATVKGGYPIESTSADFEYRWYRVENSGDIAINTDVTLDRLEKLKAGTYKVVTNDSQGATAETIIDLTQPEYLVVTLSSAFTEILCHGDETGRIDVTVIGGPKNPDTGDYLPYTYRWTKAEDPDFEATTEDLRDMPAGTYNVVVIDDNLCTTTLKEAVVINQPDASLEISNIEVTHLTGYQTGNGSISLDVNGGVKPYIYNWSNLEDTSYTSSSEDVSGLKRGNYQLLVTDKNGCTISISQEVTEPEELTVTIIPLTDDQAIQCFGEKTIIPLTTIVNGGVGEYTYQWYEQADPDKILFTTSITETPVLAGTYTVVVTDKNGNTDKDTYSVVQPENLDVSETITHLKCAGETNGEIDITVRGGVPPYTYLWSNGETSEDIKDLIYGDYTVVIKDTNNCTVAKTIRVKQPLAMFVFGDIIRHYPSSNGLRDGNITVEIRGGTPPYRYEWRDTGGVLQSSMTNVLGNVGVEKYSLTITDTNDCELFIKDVDLFEPPALEATIRQVSVISCHGNTSTGRLSALAMGGRPFNNTKQYNYQWYNADTDEQVGVDSAVLENIGAGNYYVIISDAAGETTRSLTFELNEPDQLEITFDTDFKNCGDGEDWAIVAQVKGGTAPYNYVWNTGETNNALENVVGGTYSLEVTDVRGCYVANQVVTISPETLVVSHISTIPTCYEGCNGSILLETTGGTPPYTYQWNNGDTREDLINICSNTYNVVITDSKGCQITKEIILDSPEELIVDLGEDITLCKDQSIVLNATITDPNATYLWTSTNGYNSTEPTIKISEPDTYEVVVTDSKGCVTSDSIFIDKIEDVISAQFIASTQVFVGEEFVIVDNSDPIPDHVDWIFPEEAEVTFEDNNYAEAIFNTPGEYEITMKTYLGLCTAVSTKKVVVVDKEFEGERGAENNVEINSYIDYLVYPNPTNTGRFKVDVNLSKSQNISLKIFNIVNNTLINSRTGKEKDTYTFDYNMEALPSGIYFILLETASASQVRKLIIE